MSLRIKLAIVLVFLVTLFVVWFTRRPLVMICQDRPPVLIYGEWWDGTCMYTTGPGISSGAVLSQFATCYCAWWLERHPESTWEDCQYPQTPARYFYGSAGVCNMTG